MKNDFTIGKRVQREISVDLSQDEIASKEYETLKTKLKVLIEEDATNKIEMMIVLKKISDKGFYKLDGYKTFTNFLKDFSIARSQAYVYMSLASALEENKIQEIDIIENGIKKTYASLISASKVKKNDFKLTLKANLSFENSEDFLFWEKEGELFHKMISILFFDERWRDHFEDLKTTAKNEIDYKKSKKKK